MSIGIYGNQGYSYDSGYNNYAKYNPAGQSHEQSFEKDLDKLEKLFSGDNKNGATLPPDMKELLKKIAEFMDKHPEIFGKPDGKDTWSSEMKEDDFLNGKESKQFGNALDMMKDAIGGAGGGNGQPDASKFDNALIPSGNGESTLNPSKKNELEDIAKFMDQHPEIFGKPKGKDTWLSELKENNHLDKGETKSFEKAIDLLKDAKVLAAVARHLPRHHSLASKYHKVIPPVSLPILIHRAQEKILKIYSSLMVKVSPT